MQQTFEEIARRWAAAKQPLVKYSTICAYRLTLRTHLLPYFGRWTVIDEANVQNFIVEKIILLSGKSLDVANLSF